MNWKQRTLTGWGRVSSAQVLACEPRNANEAIDAICAAGRRSIITFGEGRSYGDPALNGDGHTLLTNQLNRVVSFDADNRHIVCEPGVTFNDLLKQFLPRGFVAPVSPGTGFATIGGAVANDIHGKNHDRAGSFGDHVQWIDLLLPSGEVRRISREMHFELFAATIGGIGLTGVILAVCFIMAASPSNAVCLREERVANLDDFFAAFEAVRDTATYSVGWVDALASGANLGRGIFETAEYATENVADAPITRVKVPVDFPGFALNSWTVNAFNSAYYHRVPCAGRQRQVHIERFLYPLDAILEWNKIYGKRGFYQFQCVLPESMGREGIRSLLEEISESRSASFLAVLKTLGGEGLGCLSFPMRGYTLALDFPRKPDTDELLARLERITLDHGGRVYLAKDACLSAATFEKMYPRVQDFRALLDEIDPKKIMDSDMARRLQIRKA